MAVLTDRILYSVIGIWIKMNWPSWYDIGWEHGMLTDILGMCFFNVPTRYDMVQRGAPVYDF